MFAVVAHLRLHNLSLTMISVRFVKELLVKESNNVSVSEYISSGLTKIL